MPAEPMGREARVRTLFEQESKLERAFREYHAANPRIYQAFTRFALDAIIAGRNRIGAKMIWERLRWYTTVEARDDGFKLNNNYTAYYARKFMEDFPQHAGLFQTRRTKLK